ncbi:unnamed protein product [Lupinus luteus]|uniref:Uncharacterized protein n=1 Tax=Lupinus luteus TaxID=3873 RepID=A0AAV1W209_LUPLU
MSISSCSLKRLEILSTNLMTNGKRPLPEIEMRIITNLMMNNDTYIRMMRLPHPNAFIDVSFTLSRRRSLSPEMGHQYQTIRRLDGAGPSTSWRTWQDTRNAPPSRRALWKSMPEGTIGRRTLPYPTSYSSEQMEEEEEAEDRRSVVERVDIESSLEIVDISSDSDTEEDPSEGSSILGVF